MAATGQDLLRSIDRYGQWALLVVFLVLLGGRFALERLGDDLPAWDLWWAAVTEDCTTAVRLGPLAGWFTAWTLWMAGRPYGPRWRADVRLPGGLGVSLAFVWAGWAVAARVQVRVLHSLWWRL